jgi:hypothetical protein
MPAVAGTTLTFLSDNIKNLNVKKSNAPLHVTLRYLFVFTFHKKNACVSVGVMHSGVDAGF